MAVTQLGNVAEGTLLQLNENGSPVQFYVAKQNYESGLNGDGRVLLVRKDLYNRWYWNILNVNAWVTSTMLSRLNSDYKALLDSGIQSLMGSTQYYYTPGNGNNNVGVQSSSVFLLSATELGQSDSAVNVEGSALPIANTLKTAYLNGSAVNQWTRSPAAKYTTNAIYLSTDGLVIGTQCTDIYGVRPCFTLPSNLIVDGSTILPDTMPTPPESITVPTSAVPVGAPIAISWPAVPGASYQLCRSNGTGWIVIYSGENTSFTEAAKNNQSQVRYQVASVKSDVVSDYTVSSVVTVLLYTVGKLTVPNVIIQGQSIPLSWAAADGAATYILERSVDSGQWEQVYAGADLSFTDTAGNWTTVQYRVKAGDGTYFGSYKTSSAVTVRDYIVVELSVPEVIIQDQSVSLSWPAASSATTYILERSADSGAWVQIYSGTELNFTDTAGNWTTVQYRVKAGDGTYFGSYKTSSVVTVRRYTVAKLIVPDVVMQGQSASLSWPAASSATTYILERNADSGEWVQIYSGADLSFTDTAGSWATVQYRVKAGDGTDFGDYTTSPSIPVVSTATLVISGEDEDLGTVFRDINYTVVTDTGNQISLTRKVNGQLVATTTVQNGFSYSIPVMDLPTGSGTIEITASVNTSGGSPVTATRTWTYTKTPVTFPDTGGPAQLAQGGQNVFPPTLAEAVRVPAHWGGSLDKALEMLLLLVNSAVIQVGTYEGTGTFGVDNPSTLTFSQEPVVVTIYGGGQTLVISSTDTGSTAYLDGKTAKWYADSAAAQMNTDGTTYRYVAVGKQV